MTAALHSQLAHLLSEQISGLSVFIEILNQEREALSQRNGESIAAINTQKQQQVAALQTASQQMASLLTQLTGSDQTEDHKQWLATHLADNPDWQRWQSLAQQSRELNMQNGKLIDASMRFQEQQLNVLLPQANTTKLYTASGVTEEKSSLIRNRDIV